MSILTSCAGSPSDDSFQNLIRGLRAGDPDAAAELFHRYACRLVGLARSRISSWLQTKIDPEEVMASVFKSFFPRVLDGRLEMRNWETLWPAGDDCSAEVLAQDRVLAGARP
jgi:RNA polymerase sigma-70 factor (ECF subfamily)